MNPPVHTNRLAGETSPYLLQHAHNPVSWYPWGPEAFEAARSQNKPIFLSIGYSACHWCHVMEKESFENEKVADILKRYFISIKVDREERPDVDDLYMTAVQMLTGSGGWPMSVFLTPEGDPFYAGTYFPLTDRHGMPGFPRLVEALGKNWEVDEAKARDHGSQMREQLAETLSRGAPSGEPEADLLAKTMDELESQIDLEEGGFGSAPKFPSSMSLDLYVDHIHRCGGGAASQRHLASLRLCLRKMAQGGMYDQVGGGFHRYSTDAEWYVPHFEKMLYDNALLAGTYLNAARVVDRDFNLRIGREILDYVLREMRHPAGAFYSTTDADSEGLEGKYFLWSREEVEEILGEREGVAFCELYDIREPHRVQESFEGGTPHHAWFSGRIPRLLTEAESSDIVRRYGWDSVQRWRETLYGVRSERVAPGRDEKVLASWNGMMSSAMICGARATGERIYLEAAVSNLEFIFASMFVEGKLVATWKDGRARHRATLEDIANVAAACLDLYQAGREVLWRSRAIQLADSALEHYASPDGGAFYYASAEADDLIVRSKNAHDGAVPGANSVLAGVLSRLGTLTGQDRYLHAAEGIFKEFAGPMSDRGRGFPRMIREWEYHAGPTPVWVLLGADADLRWRAWRALRPGGQILDERDANSPLLADKLKADEPCLYPCEQGICHAPVRGSEAIGRSIDPS